MTPLRKAKTAVPKNPKKEVRHNPKQTPGKSGEIRPVVGEPWPDELTVTDAESREKAVKQDIVRWTLKLLGGLLIAFTIYAMWNHDAGMLDKTFTIVQFGLPLVFLWAVGINGPKLARALQELSK